MWLEGWNLSWWGLGLFSGIVLWQVCSCSDQSFSLARWINLKVPFHEVFSGVRCNLKEAVQLAGLVWEGRAHCGLDDAKNTAHLLARLMHLGFKFTITNSLISASPEFHPTTRPVLQSTKMAHQHHLMPFLHFQPTQPDPSKEQEIYCYCGVKSSKRMVRKPGPKHGSFFFGCGNWTTARGAACHYFKWVAPWNKALKASPSLRAKATRGGKKTRWKKPPPIGGRFCLRSRLGHIARVGVSLTWKWWEVIEWIVLCIGKTSYSVYKRRRGGGGASDQVWSSSCTNGVLKPHQMMPFFPPSFWLLFI